MLIVLPCSLFGKLISNGPNLIDKRIIGAIGLLAPALGHFISRFFSDTCKNAPAGSIIQLHLPQMLEKPVHIISEFSADGTPNAPHLVD